MGYLTENLIESVKDRSFAPISQTTFQDADILRILNEELSLSLVSSIIEKREDFFLTRTTIPLYAGKSHYPVPERAIGNAVKAIFHVDSGGNRQLLTRRDIDRLSEYSSGNGESSSFYFEGDEIALMQAPSTSVGSLLVVAPRRPSTLVLTTAVTKITSIATVGATAVFTVNTDLTARLIVGSRIDFLSASAPFQLWAEDLTITAITATTITVTLSEVSDISGAIEPVVGDYICAYGEANIPQLPIEFHPVLAQKGANRLLTALGDQAKLQAGMAIEKMMFDQALSLIRNRAESTPERPSIKRGLIKSFRG